MCRGRICFVFCLLGIFCPASNGQSFTFRDAPCACQRLLPGMSSGSWPVGGLDLAKFNTPKEMAAEAQTWEKVFLWVRLGEMPVWSYSKRLKHQDLRRWTSLHEEQWARLLAYVTGLVNQQLLMKNEYVAVKNRIFRAHLPRRLRLSDPVVMVWTPSLANY